MKNTFRTKVSPVPASLTRIEVCDDFEFKGYIKEPKSSCKVVIITQHGDSQCVVCTHHQDYIGLAPSNGLNEVRASLIENHQVSPDATFILHHPKGTGIDATQETVELAKFTDGLPIYTRTEWEVIANNLMIPISVLKL